MEIFTSYGSVLKNSFQQINADTKRCVRFDLKFLKFKIKGLILTSSGTLFISHFADYAAQNIISLRKGSTVAEHVKKKLPRYHSLSIRLFGGWGGGGGGREEGEKDRARNLGRVSKLPRGGVRSWEAAPLVY